MPTDSIASFITLDYQLAYPAGTSDAQKLKLKALKALGDLTGLGHLTTYLSCANVIAGDEKRLEERGQQLDDGLFVLGQVIAGIADEAYAAVEQYSELVKEPADD